MDGEHSFFTCNTDSKDGSESDKDSGKGKAKRELATKPGKFSAASYQDRWRREENAKGI
jgi:hypothetical protein